MPTTLWWQAATTAYPLLGRIHESKPEIVPLGDLQRIANVFQQKAALVMWLKLEIKGEMNPTNQQFCNQQYKIVRCPAARVWPRPCQVGALRFRARPTIIMFRSLVVDWLSNLCEDWENCGVGMLHPWNLFHIDKSMSLCSLVWTRLEPLQAVYKIAQRHRNVTIKEHLT